MLCRKESVNLFNEVNRKQLDNSLCPSICEKFITKIEGKRNSSKAPSHFFVEYTSRRRIAEARRTERSRARDMKCRHDNA